VSGRHLARKIPVPAVSGGSALGSLRLTWSVISGKIGQLKNQKLTVAVVDGSFDKQHDVIFLQHLLLE